MARDGKGRTGLLRRLRERLLGPPGLERRLELIRLSLGRIETRQILEGGAAGREAEFSVYSQWGEDGVIQWLVHRVPVARKVFVEIGTGDYAEANTRFLMESALWSGLLIDRDEEGLDRFRRSAGYWRHRVEVVSSLVTRENVDALLKDHGVSGDIGLLSLDIDGNDYWVLESLSSVSPRILVCEYNSLFGRDAVVTIPYDGTFSRSRAHWSCLYYGASLAALASLAERKGYALVHVESSGTNAFFVRKDVLGDLPTLTPQEGYVACCFRQARDTRGQLAFASRADELATIADLPLLDLTTGHTAKVSQLVSPER